MADPILRKAIEKRDAAIREAERWEAWIRAYEELSRPALLEDLDIPQAPSISSPAEGHDGAAPAVDPPPSSNGIWARGLLSKRSAGTVTAD
jgi:hypothetical protein